MLGRETLVGVSIAEDARLVVQASSEIGVEAGDLLPIGIEPGRMYLFDPVSELALGRL